MAKFIPQYSFERVKSFFGYTVTINEHNNSNKVVKSQPLCFDLGYTKSEELLSLLENFAEGLPKILLGEEDYIKDLIRGEKQSLAFMDKAREDKIQRIKELESELIEK